ncbi:MAG: site-specific integrase [Bacteriovoracales bacterium]|nr:site-specific integrase [Bacteriovoracales bacterium]
MAQRIYYLDGKKYYEVRTCKRMADGKRMSKRKKLDENGKRISSKIVADRVEYQIKKECDHILGKGGLWTWKSWHEECLRQMRISLQKSTVENYDGLVKKWMPSDWNDKILSEITKRDVFDLIFERITQREKVTPNTQKAVLRRIKRIFQLAVEEGILDRNPAIGIKVKAPRAEQKVLNSNEVEILLMAAKECSHRFYYHWAVALFTGMRNGELYALRWTDVDFARGLISISRQWTSKDGLHQTKSNRNRVVPICPELKKILLELKSFGPFQEKLWIGLYHIQKNANREEQLFTDLVLPRNRDWRLGFQAAALGKFCQGLGITKVKFHDLRATFITNMLSEGVPLVKVMALVGHSEVSTTNEYLRLAGVDVKEGTTEKLKYRLLENHPNVFSLSRR